MRLPCLSHAVRKGQQICQGGKQPTRCCCGLAWSSGWASHRWPELPAHRRSLRLALGWELGRMHLVGGACHLMRIHGPQVRRRTHWQLSAVLHRPACHRSTSQRFLWMSKQCRPQGGVSVSMQAGSTTGCRAVPPALNSVIKPLDTGRRKQCFAQHRPGHRYSIL